jgi:hypothetical protein
MATVVTSRGREIITSRMRGAPAAGTEPLNVGWGTGVFTAAVSDVGPFIEASEARVAGTSSQVTTTTVNDTYQVVATITAGGAKTISEVLLSDSATKPFSTTVAAGAGTVIGSSTNTAMNVAAAYTPANGTQVQVRTEVMTVTAGTGTTALTVTRGVNGSTAIATIAAADTVTAGNMPGQTGVTNGNVFLHGDFTGLALNANDSIQFTVKTQFS